MEYVKLYTSLLTHPKALGLSASAWRLLTFAWLYAGQQETDGYVPDAAKPLLHYSKKAAEELETAGWWRRNGNGWELHDWQDHQVATDELERRRELQRERTRRWRERQAGSDE